MPDPLSAIEQRLKSFEQRIKRLETSPRANRTTVRDGAMHWQPPDPTLQNPQLWIGNDAFTPETQNVEMRVYDGDGNNAILIGTQGLSAEPVHRVDNPDNTRAVSYVIGGRMVAPLVSSGWQKDPAAPIDASGRPTTTSASYLGLHRALLPITSGGVWTEVDVVPGAGNTVSARLLARRLGFPAETVLWEQTGITATTRYTIETVVPDTLVDPAGSPIGVLAQIELQIRRTAGAGAVTAAPVYPIGNVFAL